MREVEASFSLASSSSANMSRDPDAVNGHDEYGSQLEPSGTLPDEYNASTMTSPAESYANMEGFDGGERKAVLDVSKFIGVPPPPPNSTPPQRKNLNKSSAPLTNECNGLSRPIAKDVSSISVSSSPPKSRNIVAERLQLARSMYESNVLVLDDEYETKSFSAADTPHQKNDIPEEVSSVKRTFNDEYSHNTLEPEDVVSHPEIEIKGESLPDDKKEVAHEVRSEGKLPKRTKKRGFFKKLFGKNHQQSFSEENKRESLGKNVDTIQDSQSETQKKPLEPKEMLKSPDSSAIVIDEVDDVVRNVEIGQADSAVDPPDDEMSSRPNGSPVSLRVESKDDDYMQIETKESINMEPAGASPVVQGSTPRRNFSAKEVSGDERVETLNPTNTSRGMSSDPSGTSLCHEAKNVLYHEGDEYNGVDEEVSSIDGNNDTMSSNNHQVLSGPIDSDLVLARTEIESEAKEVGTKQSKLHSKWVEEMKSISAVNKKIEKTRAMMNSSSGNNIGSQNALEAQFEMEKSGFNKTAQNGSEAKEQLTVNMAAFTNAKAIAYLHKLEGDVSPRHTYHSKHSIAPPLLEKSVALAKIRKFNAKRKKNKTKKVPLLNGPSPDEYSAVNAKIQEQINGNPKKNYVSHDPNKQFAAYSRFQGRRPRKAAHNKGGLESMPLDEMNNLSSPLVNVALIAPSERIAGLALLQGMELRKTKECNEFEDDRLERMILKSRLRPTRASRFNFFPAAESEIKDPIQRAARKLLSKAAIPIQANIRMFLAKKKSIDKMWALIRLQSYFRRWKCEAYLHEQKASASTVQKIYRGHLVRKDLKSKHDCATRIQKIVRGYLGALHAYEAIFYISRAQALARGFLVRNANARRSNAVLTIQAFFKKYLREKNYAAAVIQSHYLEYSLREREKRMHNECATIIQSSWRCYSARIAYEMCIVDIITVQSIVRRRAACRRADLTRKSIHAQSITKFQAAWRGFDVRNRQLKDPAATKIQAAWRGFSAYTDFIFTIVDILVVQRTVRQWLARRKVIEMRRERAAIVLQSTWRRKQAEVNFLYSLVNIIIVQSIARRFLAKIQLKAKEKEREQSIMVEHRKELAATTIQKTWRGFWGFSHFIIVRYEITRIQALARGKFARDEFNLKIGCAILIQAVARRYLARRSSAPNVVDKVLIESKALELRERNSAKRIQFWWRIVLDYMVEKRAALVIERFFIFVKFEVDREIRALERKQMMKQKAKLKSASGIHLGKGLEKGRYPGDKRGNRSKSAQRSRQPQNKMAMKESGYESFGISGMKPPPEFLHLGPKSDHSVVSNLTNPSILNQFSRELETPRALEVKNEEKYQEVKARPKNRLSTEDYIKKYGSGLQTAPNSLSQAQSRHFFSDDSTGSKPKRKSFDGTSKAQAQSHSKANQPRIGRVQSGNKIMTLSTVGLENGSDGGGKLPPTPRSRSGSTPRAVSRNRRDGISSQYLPPMTPNRKKASGILRAATADTECSTLETENKSIPPRPSSSRRHPGVHNRGGHSVKVLKSYPNYMDDKTLEEAHEMMLLGDDYGEV